MNNLKLRDDPLDNTSPSLYQLFFTSGEGRMGGERLSRFAVKRLQQPKATERGGKFRTNDRLEEAITSILERR